MCGRPGSPVRDPRATVRSGARWRAILVLALLLPCLPGSGWAEPSAGQIAAWKARFADGLKLVEAGKFTEALAIFDGILAEDPKARGSLLMSGIALNHLGRWTEADQRLTQFLALQPGHVTGTLAAVQAKQGLGKTAEADRFRDQLRRLRREGKDQRLNAMKSFERQRELRPGGGTWIVLETFQPEGTDAIWAMIALDAAGKQTRRVEWAPLPPESGQKGFVLGEPLYREGVLVRYKIHRVAPALPDYDAARAALAEILAVVPAP